MTLALTPTPPRFSPEPTMRVGLLLAFPMAVVLLALVGWPVIRLVQVALPDGLSMDVFVRYFENAARAKALFVTFRDSAAVAIIACILGFVLAWTAINTPWRWLKVVIWMAVTLPMLMGTVVKNYAMLIILARRGILNGLLVNTRLVDAPLPLLYNETAVIIGILYTLLPYAVVPIFTALMTIDMDMVRAAQSMGASRFSAIRTIVLPLLAPSLVGTCVLIFVISVGFYIVPVVLGGATAPFIATLIDNDLTQFFDLRSAAIASVVLICLSMTAVAITVATIGVDQVNRSAAGGG